MVGGQTGVSGGVAREFGLPRMALAKRILNTVIRKHVLPYSRIWGPPRVTELRRSGGYCPRPGPPGELRRGEYLEPWKTRRTRKTQRPSGRPTSATLHASRILQAQPLPCPSCWLLLVAGQAVWATLLITFPAWPKGGLSSSRLDATRQAHPSIASVDHVRTAPTGRRSGTSRHGAFPTRTAR